MKHLLSLSSVSLLAAILITPVQAFATEAVTPQQFDPAFVCSQASTDECIQDPSAIVTPPSIPAAPIVTDPFIPQTVVVPLIHDPIVTPIVTDPFIPQTVVVPLTHDPIVMPVDPLETPPVVTPPAPPQAPVAPAPQPTPSSHPTGGGHHVGLSAKAKAAPVIAFRHIILTKTATYALTKKPVIIALKTSTLKARAAARLAARLKLRKTAKVSIR